MDDIVSSQQVLCEKFHTQYAPAPLALKVGISKRFCSSAFPINGLRHPVSDDTTGWYIWSGEWSDDPDFFVPLHAVHLIQRCPEVIRYLGLPPGWRFLFASGYEDVWEDNSLLNI